MSTNLATMNDRQNAAIAAGGLGLDGAAALRPTPMVLVQPTTDVQGIMPGVFLDRMTGTQFPELDLVLLSIQTFREKYPSAEFKRGERPICKSRDGVMPILDNPDLIVVNPSGCATCPAASWDGYNYKTKTGPKPTCREKRRLIFIEAATGLPFFMTVQGKAVKTIKLLVESITRNAIMQNKKFEIEAAKTGNKNPRKMNLFDYKITLASQRTDAYFSLVVKSVNPMAQSEAEQFGPMYMELIARKREIEEQIEAEQNANVETEGSGTIEGI